MNPHDRIKELETQVERLRAENERLQAQLDSRGTWPLGSQRAFVEGAEWWQWKLNGFTLFPSEKDELEAEAVKRFGRVKD